MTNAEPSNFRRCEALRTQPLFRRVQWLSQFVCQDQRKKEVRFCKIWPMQKYNLTLLKNLHFLAFLNRNVIWELPFFSFQFGRRWNVQFGKWPFNRWPTTQSSKPSNSHFEFFLSWREKKLPPQDVWQSSIASPLWNAFTFSTTSTAVMLLSFYGQRFNLRKVQNGNLCHFHEHCPKQVLRNIYKDHNLDPNTVSFHSFNKSYVCRPNAKLDKESVDSKVLVFANIPNLE